MARLSLVIEKEKSGKEQVGVKTSDTRYLEGITRGYTGKYQAIQIGRSDDWDCRLYQCLEYPSQLLI